MRKLTAEASLHSLLKPYKGIAAVLPCISLDRTPIVFNVVQLVVELGIEDAFMSAFGYLNLRLKFFVKKIWMCSGPVADPWMAWLCSGPVANPGHPRMARATH